MKYKKEEYEELLNTSINRANNSINHFIELLNIEPELFNNLFNVNISIDYDKNYVYDSECATCEMGNSKKDAHIYIGYSYIDSLIDALKNNISKQKVINSLSSTIIHELMHINRSIIIKEKYNIDTLRCINKYDLNNIDESILTYDKDNNDFKIYDVLLEESINNNFYDYFDDYVPLKLKNNLDGTYDVVAYSKKKNSYDFFDKKKLLLLFGKENIMLFVGLELNSKVLKNNPVKIVHLNKDNFTDKVHDPADYIFNDITDINSINNQLDSQISFEETMVEVISQIILHNRKNNKIDLDISDNFNQNNLMDEKLCDELIKKMGISFVKWFILSSREEEYDNQVYKIFNNRYDLLLESILELRNNTYNDDEYNKNAIKNIELIMKEKLHNNKNNF